VVFIQFFFIIFVAMIVLIAILFMAAPKETGITLIIIIALIMINVHETPEQKQERLKQEYKECLKNKERLFHDDKKGWCEYETGYEPITD